MMWTLLATALAGVPEDVERCLRRNDVPCAEVHTAGIDIASATSVPLLLAKARVEFNAGRYPSAHAAIARAAELGGPELEDDVALYERTMFATAGFTEVARGRYRVRYRPGLDAVLIDEAFDALERGEAALRPILGSPPPGTTILEIFPDVRSFTAASSLSRDDVDTTGVVALSKWTRLLLTSPRAQGRGFDWQETAVHEFIHLVVAHQTDDRAPVWMQEGIARMYEGRWAGASGTELERRERALIGQALREGGLVPFQEMHPSLAKIKVMKEDGSIDPEKSGARASLAYAQLHSLMAFCVKQKGEGLFLQLFPKVRDGTDPRVALASVSGYNTFDELETAWKASIQAYAQEFGPTTEPGFVPEGATEAEADPLLAKREDLSRYLRLGDLLRDRQHFRAALHEYARARDDESPGGSPLVSARIAEAHVALDEYDLAQAELDRALHDHPESEPLRVAQATLFSARGDDRKALDAMLLALQLDPFDIEHQDRALALAERVGDAWQVEQRRARLAILEFGGESKETTPIHEEYGTYVVPGEERVEAGAAAPLQPAPKFTARTLDGAELTLESLLGRVVIVDFWATWCGPCRAIMPRLSAMQAELDARGLTVVGLTKEDHATVTRFLAKERAAGRDLKYTLALDANGDANLAYGVKSIPTLAVIDRKGVLRTIHVGAGDLTEVTELVHQLLEEK